MSLLIKYYDADGQPYTKELPLPVASLLRAGVLTPAQLADLNTADRNETTARQASDAEPLRRIQGKCTSSSAYSDPYINIGGFDHLYAEDGTTIIKRATIEVQICITRVGRLYARAGCSQLDFNSRASNRHEDATNGNWDASKKNCNASKKNCNASRKNCNASSENWDASSEHWDGWRNEAVLPRFLTLQLWRDL